MSIVMNSSSGGTLTYRSKRYKSEAEVQRRPGAQANPQLGGCWGSGGRVVGPPFFSLRPPLYGADNPSISERISADVTTACPSHGLHRWNDGNTTVCAPP